MTGVPAMDDTAAEPAMTFDRLDRASVDYLLTTTRGVRRRLDTSRPVPTALVEECIDLAVQAPTGANAQTWRFVVVTDPDTRAALADLYTGRPGGSGNLERLERTGITMSLDRDDPRAEPRDRMIASALHLREHLKDVPVLVVVCVEGRLADDDPNLVRATFYGSVMPATWSLMLALRSRGLASALTTVHLENEDRVADLLGIPDGVTQVALLPVAYALGTEFRPANRLPAREVTYHDSWGVRHH